MWRPPQRDMAADNVEDILAQDLNGGSDPKGTSSDEESDLHRELQNESKELSTVQELCNYAHGLEVPQICFLHSKSCLLL